MSPKKRDSSELPNISTPLAPSKKTRTKKVVADTKTRTEKALEKQQKKEDIASCIREQESIFQQSSYKNYYENYSLFLARVKRADEAGKNWKGSGMIIIPPVVLYSRFWQLQEAFCDEKDWRVPKYKNRDILDNDAISWLRINPERIPDDLYRCVFKISFDAPISLQEKAAGVQKIKAFIKHGKTFLWNKLVDASTQREHSKENRMYWWNSHLAKNVVPTFENTTCHILELSGDRMPRFFGDAYTAKREIKHIIEGNKEAIEDMDILLKKIKTIRIQIESIETFDLKSLLEKIRQSALRIIDPTITILDIFTDDIEVTREAYLGWKKSRGIQISGDEQLLSDIERYAIDKQSRDRLIEKGCTSAYESFMMTTGLRTDLGKRMRNNLFKIQDLKDSRGNWNPGAFLASTIAAIDKVEKRKIELERQILAMNEHGIVLEHYLLRHEQHFRETYLQNGETPPLPLE